MDGTPGDELLVDAGMEHFVAVLDGSGGQIEDATRRWSGGIAVALSAADLDGDGRQDAVLTIAPPYDVTAASPENPTVYGWTGEIGGVMPVRDAPAWLDPGWGETALSACTGDWDADGVSDYAATVGVETTVFLGPLGAGARAPDLTITQEGTLETNGPRCTGEGDLDGDGRDDLVLVDGLGGDVNGGMAAAFTQLPVDRSSLASADVILLGQAEGDAFGSSVAVGDVDGDGDDDLVVGAPGTDRGAEGLGKGQVTVFTGPVGSGGPESGTMRVSGEVDGVGLGATVAIGDGWLAASTGGLGDFEAALFLLDATWTGDHTTAEAFLALSGGLADGDGPRLAVGDLDGSGQRDLVAADWLASSGAEFSGVVFVVPASALVAESRSP